MIKKVIEIAVDAKNAKDEIEKVNDALGETTKEAKKASEATDDVGSKTKKVGRGAKALKKIRNGFKAIGAAIKATGIGLVVGAIAAIGEAFSRNQKFMDGFNVVMGTIQRITDDFVTFVINNFGTVVEQFKAVFENPKESLIEFGNAIKDNLIERFNSFLDTLGFVAKAIKQVFEGDFSGALESVKNAGKELVDITTGVDGSFDKISDTVTKATVKFTAYVKKTAEAESKLVDLTKAAEIAAAKQAELVEEYDRQAETLRQTRDNDLLTIEERKAANDELLVVLNKQEEAMMAEANAQLAAAQANFEKNKNIETEKALIEARTNAKGVEAQITGFLSEQEANRVALAKEGIELNNSQAEATANRQIAEKVGNAELIDNDVARLEKLREIADEEEALQIRTLTAKRDAYKKGTQAYQDADNELLDFQQQSGVIQKKMDQDIADAKVSAITGALGTLAGIAGENSKFGKALAVTQAVIDTYAGANKAIAQGGIFGGIAAAGIIASGLANVKNILSTKEATQPSFAKGATGTQPVAAQAATPSAPSFSIVGQTGTNQLAEVIGNQEEKPVRAYVVSKDVSTAQELDRNIVDDAGL